MRSLGRNEYAAVLCLAVVLAARPPAAFADTAHVAADATIREGSTQNFGAAITIEVSSLTAGQAKAGLARFSLGSLPAGVPISAAYLRVYVAKMTGNAAGTLGVFPVVGFWEESTVRWPGPELGPEAARAVVLQSRQRNY